jgi:adenylate cyclase class IV
MRIFSGKKKISEGSSPDHYYSSPKKKNDGFFRYREDKKQPELTRKKRLNKTNTWVRYENDLPLDPKRVTRESIHSHLITEGYAYNFSIYKTFTIYKYSEFNFVYYKVYSLGGEYKGTFIEVEVNKELIKNKLDQKRYFAKLIKKEKLLLKELGLNPRARLKDALFDLYRIF